MKVYVGAPAAARCYLEAGRGRADDYLTEGTGVARRYSAGAGDRVRTEVMIRLHIEGTRLGGRRLADVRPSEVQAWATDRSRVLAPTTLRQAVGLLRSVYGAAVLDRLVGSSPVVRVQLPRHERQRVVPLSVEQVLALALAMPERYRTMVLTQAGLGLRIGELLALRVQDGHNLIGRAVTEAGLPQGTTP